MFHLFGYGIVRAVYLPEKMKRRASDVLPVQSKRIEFDPCHLFLQVVSNECFLQMIGFRTFYAVSTLNKSLNEFMKQQISPKQKASQFVKYWKQREFCIRLPVNKHVVRRLSGLTNNQFIDYGLNRLFDNYNPEQGDCIFSCLKPWSPTKLHDYFEEIDKHGISFGWLRFCIQNIPYDLSWEFIFRNESCFWMLNYPQVFGTPPDGAVFHPFFTNWKTLDDVDLFNFSQLQKHHAFPPPRFWTSGHHIIKLIYNQPGFAMLKHMKLDGWRDIDVFLSYCTIDYTEQDLIDLGMTTPTNK